VTPARNRWGFLLKKTADMILWLHKGFNMIRLLRWLFGAKPVEKKVLEKVPVKKKFKKSATKKTK